MTHPATTRRSSRASAGAVAARLALGWTLERPALLGIRLGLEVMSIVAALLTAWTALSKPLEVLVARAPEGLGEALAGALGVATSPGHIIAVGVSAGACATLAVTSGAVSDALAWGEYKDRAASAPRRPLHALLSEWFARALGWRALRALVRLGVGVAFATMYVAALVLPGKLSGAPLLSAGLTALMYSAAMVWTALTLGAVEIAPAGAISRGLGLGESLLWGARQVVSRPATYYRVLVVCAVVMLPGLALSVCAALAVGTTNLHVSLQLTSQLVTLTGACALALAFRGATVALATEDLITAEAPAEDGLARVLPPEGADVHLISLSALRSSLLGSDESEEE